MRQCCLIAVLGSILLTGCSAPPATTSQSLPFIPMAVPIQPSARNEVSLMRIDHILQRRELSNEDKAKLYFERGLINDSLGLRNIAQIDFDRSLFFNPSQPEIFNILGVYYTQDAKYDSAYDAFDSALELNNEHQFALRNRGIALYYAGRLRLAERDLLKHYESNFNDPYRSIWLYIVEFEQYGEKKAQENLKLRYEESDKTSFGWEIVRLYLNEITENEFIKEVQINSYSNQQLAERFCEGYFYLAKRYQIFGKEKLANTFYKLAMASNMYDFVEHRFSILELSKIAEKRKKLEG